MWPKQFENLDAMSAFLAQHIAFAEGSFSFMGIAPGQTLEDIRNSIGEPEEKTVDTETQQTLQFTAPIDHATHGRRDHHVLRALFLAFNHEPIQLIRIQFNYYRWGQDSDAFAVSLHALGDALTAKLGAPSKRSNRRGKHQFEYAQGKRKLMLFEGTDSVTIQLM